MDNVLFYGERDEHTRRQVRSAAAAHSHRIGPRKAKAGGKASTGSSKSDTTARRRTTPKAGSTSDSVTEETMSSAQDDSVFRRSAPPTSSSVDCAGVQQGWDQLSSSTVHAHHGLEGSAHHYVRPQTAMPTPPVQHRGILSPRLRDMSPATRQSPPESQRLPAYSWTEYPRYGLGSNRLQSLDMLADVAASERRAPRLSPPGGVPEFRLFRSSVEQRSPLPPLPLPLPPTTSSPSHVDGRGEAESTDAQIKSEIVEVAPPHAPRAPCATPHFPSMMSPG